ncbi:MAG: Rpn family recombination-promoting nuclease/putative transposase, partial [Coprobacillus sp.]
MIICKPDITLKDYFKDKEHFADFINVIQFHGQPILSADKLSPIDTDMSTVLDGKNVTVTYERNRDILMRSQHGQLYVLTALENQKAIDYHMPLRNLVYDALHYNQQLRDYLKKDRENKERFYLEPLHTLTIYYGEPRWSAPRTLKDMMNCPDIYDGVINNWNANIVDIKDIDFHLFKNEDNRDFIKGIQMFYQGSRNQFKPHMRVSKDIAILIISIVNNGEFLEIIKEEEGEKVDMCTLI